MMSFDHDDFLPAVVTTMSPYCKYNSRQYDDTIYDILPRGNQYASTNCTRLPLPGDSPRTSSQSVVHVCNDRLVPSAHIAPLPLPSSNSQHTSPSYVHACNDGPTTCANAACYTGSQNTVVSEPYVATLGSRQCLTRHSPTEGVDPFPYILVTNSINPVTTHDRNSRVNPYPNMVARLETPSLANSNHSWEHSPPADINSERNSLHSSSNTSSTASYCRTKQFLVNKAHFILQFASNKLTLLKTHLARPTMSPPSPFPGSKNPTNPTADLVPKSKEDLGPFAEEPDCSQPVTVLTDCAILPIGHSNIYTATNKSFPKADINTTNPLPKSPEQARNKTNQKIKGTMTPEQESTIFAEFAKLVATERHHTTNDAKNNISNISYIIQKKTANDTGHPTPATTPAPAHNLTSNVKNFHDITRQIAFSPIITRKMREHYTSVLRPEKKRRMGAQEYPKVSEKGDNNRVDDTDSHLIPSNSDEDRHSGKFNINGSSCLKAFQLTFSFANPTDINLNIPVSATETTAAGCDEHPLNSLPDDAPGKGESDTVVRAGERAFKNTSVFENPANIHGDIDLHVDEHEDDDNRNECDIVDGGNSAGAEQATWDSSTDDTAYLPTDSAEIYRMYFSTTPDNVIPFFRHRINAVIKGGELTLPPTPLRTTSRRSPGTLFDIQNDENTNTSNSPMPDNVECPMSERDHTVDNDANCNFNDDDPDNGYDVAHNNSGLFSIYSQPEQSSRPSVHFYTPELTRDPTNTTTTDGIPPPMTEVFIENLEKLKLPSSDSPPRPPLTDRLTADTDKLTTKLPAQTDNVSRHPATNILEATDKIKKTTRFSVTDVKLPRDRIAHLDSSNPFYFIPISSHDKNLPPIIEYDESDEPYIPNKASLLINDFDALSTPTPYKYDRNPSPYTFATETFSPLFSRLSSHDSAYDCLSTATGITNFIEMSSNHSSEEEPYRLDIPYVPSLTARTLNPIHHVPFLQHYPELDSRTNPQAALLYYADATIHDEINGPVTMRDLPACVDVSITAATFCLRYIHSDATTKNCIRDLTTNHLRHFFRELYPVLTADPATLTDSDDIEYIQCLQHTLNRATNLVMDSLNPEQISQFPNGTPASYLSLLSDHEPDSLGHECALAILYALKTLHLIHFLTYSSTYDATINYMRYAAEVSSIAW